MDAIHLTAAGNTLAPALAELKRMGFTISLTGGAGAKRTYRAERASATLVGNDVLQLLALATLLERRGPCSSNRFLADWDLLRSMDPAGSVRPSSLSAAAAKAAATVGRAWPR